MTLGIETELKFKGRYNNQLKYSHNSLSSIDKIKSILTILEINHKKEWICQQKDEYFDTDNYDLLKQECSLRIRTVDSTSKQSLTYKKPPLDRKITENSLRRNEHDKKNLSCKTDKEKYKVIQNFANENLDKLKMRPTANVIVNNERITIPINTTGDKHYSLCLDKFTFSNVDNHSSDDHYEIEIESENENEKDITDEKILSLSKLFVDIFSFVPNKESKYIRGCRWLENQNEIKHKQFIALDVVGYSLKDPIMQKRIVKHLTLILKQILQRYSLEEVTRLPLGDGMILVFSETPNIIFVLTTILMEIQKTNKSIPDDYKIHVRSALHYGDVFDCQDINDNKNFVGDGINITARIINETKKHQVLFSEELYKYYHSKDLINDNQYGETFNIIDKHDNTVAVRNYYNPSMEIGISI
jgi:uncharacterized protein YjbK